MTTDNIKNKKSHKHCASSEYKIVYRYDSKDYHSGSNPWIEWTCVEHNVHWFEPLKEVKNEWYI